MRPTLRHTGSSSTAVVSGSEERARPLQVANMTVGSGVRGALEDLEYQPDKEYERENEPYDHNEDHLPLL